jgi:hypothetical protein
MTAKLPQFAQDLLAAKPSRGGGLHNWLFCIARVLHGCRRQPDEIIELLYAITAGEPVKPHEIEDAVENSKAVAWQPNGQTAAALRQPTWPKLDQQKRQTMIASGAGLVDLWERSPVRFELNLSYTERIIDALFPDNPLLCVGRSNSDFFPQNQTRQELRGRLRQLAVIVPNPMTARVGLTKTGKQSAHALAITGKRRFLVIEQDSGSIDEQAAILLRLAERAPLTLAVFSGHKSIHGWFFCAGQSDEFLRRFMAWAVTLGADPALWTRSQFTRMPDGCRENGKRETVFFFNPATIK